MVTWLRVLAVAAVVAACAPRSQSTVVPAVSSPTPLVAETLQPTSDSAPSEPSETLPGGLEPRHGGHAPLVNGEAAACIPLCGKGRVGFGALPAGRYQTVWFFGGYMTIETDGTWQRTEDSDGELSLPVSGSGDDTYRLAFFLDPLLVVDDQPRQVDRTAAAYVEWLAANRELVVSMPIATTIGPVPATAVDIRLAASAPHQYPDCPDACVTFLRVPAFDHSDGILGDDVYRFIFADVSYSATDHLLVVKVEGRDRADLDVQLERVAPLIASVVVPAKAGHLGS